MSAFCRLLWINVINNNIYFILSGAGSKPPLDNIDLSRMVGLIFAYDGNKIRVWAPEKGIFIYVNRIANIIDISLQ